MILIVNSCCSAALERSYPLADKKTVPLGELTDKNVSAEGWPLEAKVSIHPGECIEVLDRSGVTGNSSHVIAKATLGASHPRELYVQYFGLDT